MAMMILKGQGVARKDEAEAVRLVWLAAHQGNPKAMNNLGGFYHRGVGGLPVDMVEATKWWKKSAAAGHAKGQYNLDRYGL